MRIQEVEIYSDAVNAAIMRHPGRQFPGLLLQGDTLHSMYRQVDRVCAIAKTKLTEDECDEIDELREWLYGYVEHYKQVLREHGIELPFYEGV
ncbi:DUF6959 family protein [Pseudomonas sp. CGJS7]|uniref:DUF6959 family protein n=1 Tax=Pseudomonas sp. CGJS7 TaxID=3109348 RepID=UPI00300B72F9